MGDHIRASKSKMRTVMLSAGLVAVLATGTVSTVAGFTSNATSAVSLTAGKITLTAGGVSSFPVAFGTGWKPGSTGTKDITLKNAGNLPLKYTVTTTGAKTLAAVVDAELLQGTTVLYKGKLNGLKTTAARTLAAGASEKVTLKLTWVSGTAAVDNAVQDIAESIVMTFAGVQV